MIQYAIIGLFILLLVFQATLPPIVPINLVGTQTNLWADILAFGCTKSKLFSKSALKHIARNLLGNQHAEVIKLNRKYCKILFCNQEQIIALDVIRNTGCCPLYIIQGTTSNVFLLTVRLFPT